MTALPLRILSAWVCSQGECHGRQRVDWEKEASLQPHRTRSVRLAYTALGQSSPSGTKLPQYKRVINGLRLMSPEFERAEVERHHLFESPGFTHVTSQHFTHEIAVPSKGNHGLAVLPLYAWLRRTVRHFAEKSGIEISQCQTTDLG
jgi:hypothetical protein